MNLLTVLLIFSHLSPAFVKDPAYDEFENLDLIEALIDDGKLDLAQEELRRPKNREKNIGRHQQLQAQWYFSKENWAEALKTAQKNLSQSSGEVKIKTQKIIARSEERLKKFKSCAQHFAEIHPVLAEKDILSQVHCEIKSQQMEKAWQTLQSAQQKMPSFALAKADVQLKLQLKMQQVALRRALEELQKSDTLPTHVLAMAELFHNEQQDDLALSILELGRARFPLDLDINLSLAQMQFQKGQNLSAIEGFSRAATKDPKYHYHSAELLRQEGLMERSLYQNLQIVDQKEKLKQKLALYVDQGRFSMIASLESVIERSELIQDEEVLYALAYSLVLEGQKEKPLKYLSLITKPDLLEKATQLRQSLL